MDTSPDAQTPSEMKKQAIIDGLVEPVMAIGTDYRVLLMNEAAIEVSGRTVPEAEAPLCYRISHHRDTPCDGTEHPCPLEQVRASGEPTTVIHEHYGPDGELRTVEVLAAPLRAQDGSLLGIIESNRDITERVQAEEALEVARRRQKELVDAERERIARDLHDELAQLLGYVTTKAMAVRLMLENGQEEAADQHLLRLEEAARELFVDVRQAILDLRTTGRSGARLTDTLKDFTAQFSRLSDLRVELSLDPEVENLHLPPETELQLLRIAQEALANVRKHASATQAWVSLEIGDDRLTLIIRDDGQGFEPHRVRATDRPHLGLSTMRQRAAAIGATLSLDSEPGAGTRVMVQLPVGNRRKPASRED